MVSVTDVPSGDDTKPSGVEFPSLRSSKELDQYVEQTYGRDVGDALRRSVTEQQSVVEDLHKHGLNGNAESLERMYRLHRQELDRKETLLGKTWKAVKWPFKKAWEFAKKHPVITVLLVSAAAAGGMYVLWSYAGSIIPIPNPSIGAAEVAEAIAAPTGGEFGAVPIGEVVAPNLSTPYPLELPPNLQVTPDMIPGVPPPVPTGTASDFFSPNGFQ